MAKDLLAESLVNLLRAAVKEIDEDTGLADTGLASETPRTEKPNCSLVHGTIKAVSHLMSATSVALTSTFGESDKKHDELGEELKPIMDPMIDKHEKDTLTWDEYRQGLREILLILADKLK